jgi:hypothetical protein
MVDKTTAGDPVCCLVRDLALANKDGALKMTIAPSTSSSTSFN